MTLQKTSKKKIKNKALTNRHHQPLTLRIATHQRVWQNLTSYGCVVTKSWRSPSSQCTKSPQSPQLFQIQSKNQIIPFPSHKRCNFYFYVAEWPIENCDIKEPYCPKQYMRFCNAIWFKGKYYALSLQGSVAVIDDLDSGFRIAAVGENRAVPCKSWRHFREYLMQLDGELLLVFLVSRKSIDVVEDVEVYRLDIEKLLWVKVEGLGERALFIEDEERLWVDASKLGCKKNCVYFTHNGVDKWFAFDMESGHISQAFGFDGEDPEFVMWVTQRPEFD